MIDRVVPALRVTPVNDGPVHVHGRHVLYWMIAARRTRASFGLQHAIAWARELGRPLLVLEALRVGHPWASPRIHRFVLAGMADQAARFAATPIAYHPYVEPRAGDGHGLLAALAADACVVVTDELPCFFLPRMVAAAGRALAVRLEQVDGHGLLPLRAADKAFTAAVHFRRVLQRELPRHLANVPVDDPLELARELPPATVPAAVLARWPAAAPALLAGADGGFIDGLPLDHEVTPVPFPGGERAAHATLDAFVRGRLARYGAARHDPTADASSGLSPYLHFGHLGAHAVAARLFAAEGWSPERLAPRPTGSREGWWGLSAPAEAFLDQLVTWRELGFNVCHHDPSGYDRWSGLPSWARATLTTHAADPRPVVYTRAQLERAETHDPLWNAAQRQLRREGRIHNYLRMLWAKKVLEWTPRPEEAFDLLIELNDRWAIDGRDPSSYTGIAWCFGRYDRPWPPERPIFGTVRFMSSANTAKKLDVRGYLARYAAGA